MRVDVSFPNKIFFLESGKSGKSEKSVKSLRPWEENGKSQSVLDPDPAASFLTFRTSPITSVANRLLCWRIYTQRVWYLKCRFDYQF